MTDPSPAVFGAFMLVSLLLLFLPFVPALREWLRPTDLAPLPVAAYGSDIDHFARRLRADALARLGRGPATGYEDFDFVPDAGAGNGWTGAKRRLIAGNGIDTPAAVDVRVPLYAEGPVRCGQASRFEAVYATQDIDLPAGSEVRDWAHAGGVLRMGRGSTALRRVSAGHSLELGPGTWFERLNAPTLRFGPEPARAAPEAAARQEPANLADLPGAVRQTRSLYLVRGDCALPPARIYEGSLVVTGFLTVGGGTTLAGDVKARKGVSIGPGAQVLGAVTCQDSIRLHPGARVLGPMLSEEDVLVGAGAVLGTADEPTTLSARSIIAEGGAIVHGTAWAHEAGMVGDA